MVDDRLSNGSAGASGGRDRLLTPGEVATPMTGQEDEDPRGKEREKVPLGGPGDAREIASCIAWLCSKGAAWTTGASFVVDGGYMLVSPSSMPQDL